MLLQPQERSSANNVIIWREEVLLRLRRVYRQCNTVELAVYSRSTELLQQQLSLLLHSLCTLLSSLYSFPAALLLYPILRSFAALNATPLAALTLQTRTAEAALMGMACLAAAQLQVKAHLSQKQKQQQQQQQQQQHTCQIQ